MVHLNVLYSPCYYHCMIVHITEHSPYLKIGRLISIQLLSFLSAVCLLTFEWMTKDWTRTWVYVHPSKKSKPPEYILCLIFDSTVFGQLILVFCFSDVQTKRQKFRNTKRSKREYDIVMSWPSCDVLNLDENDHQQWCVCFKVLRRANQYKG